MDEKTHDMGFDTANMDDTAGSFFQKAQIRFCPLRELYNLFCPFMQEQPFFCKSNFSATSFKKFAAQFFLPQI